MTLFLIYTKIQGSSAEWPTEIIAETIEEAKRMFRRHFPGYPIIKAHPRYSETGEDLRDK